MNKLLKLFGFDPARTTLRTEIVAGLTIFVSMSYVLAVNPSVLSRTGADAGAVFTATALAAAVGTILLGLMAKVPFAQAPSMGMNAFVAFTVCLGMGYSWHQALALMLVEALLYLLITSLNISSLILNHIPETLRRATTVGVGMFITFIGLKNAGIVVSNPDTVAALGAFTPAAGVGFIAIVASAVLMALGVKGALFFAIVIATLAGIPMGVTAIPDGWSPVSMPMSMESQFCGFSFDGILNLKSLMVVFSLLMVNVFDAMGTLVGLSYKVGNVGKDGKIPHVREAMLSNALGTTLGALLGSCTLGVYVESATGVAEGGKSGVSALTVGVLFLFSLVLAPLFLLIPIAATSGALVTVGVLMLDGIKQVDLDDMTEAFPAFATIMMMVLCSSVADGIAFGFLAFVAAKVLTGRWRELNAAVVVIAALFVANFMLG